MESVKTESVVLLVHGTFDGDNSTAGERWWQDGSTFSSKLRDAADALPSRVRLERFVWSGLNLESARRHAAQELAYELRELLT
jgi:hypothetical protein